MCQISPTGQLSMDHPSYPGYYAAPLSARAINQLAAVARAMIPHSEGFPDADVLVPRFVSERITPDGRVALEALLDSGGGDLPADATAWLSRLEREDPDSFVMVRNWVYFGYYGSGGVAEALRHGGSDYHGAPQPFGYRLDRENPLPRTPRGSYQTTEEMRRVTQ